MKTKLITTLMIMLFLTSITTVAIPVKARTTWTVDDDPGADFTSIQEAVDAANPGDTIRVRTGTYSSVYVDKSLKIRAVGTAVIDGEYQGIVVVDANDVTIRGFIITNGGFGISIYGTSSNVKIIGNTVQYFDYDGIRLGETVSNNEIIGNTVLDCGDTGISMWNGASYNKVFRNTVQDCQVGIETGNGANYNEITLNKVENNWWGIIIGFGTSWNKVYHNKAYNNVGEGIWEGAGIRVDGDDNEIRFNRALDNGVDLYEEGTGNVWEHNKFETASWL